MKKYLVLFLILSSVISFVAADDSPCSAEYKSAIRFTIDTTVKHPFSINATGGKVLFSRGNLQYNASKDLFRFAQRQVDFCGNGDTTNSRCNVLWDSVVYVVDAVGDAVIDPATGKQKTEIRRVPCNNLQKDRSYAGWVDLFAWGTSGHGKKAKDTLAKYFGPYDWINQVIDATYNYSGYGPSFLPSTETARRTFNPNGSFHFDTLSGTNRYFDWGFYNMIKEYNNCTHTDAQGRIHWKDSTMYYPAVWRTLTAEEWTYVLSSRTNIDGQNGGAALLKIQYTSRAKDTVCGVAIFPDDYSSSLIGVQAITFATFGTSGMSVTSIDSTTWAVMEEAGVVFLPNAGCMTVTGAQKSMSPIANTRSTVVPLAWACNGSSAQSAKGAVVLTMSTRTITATQDWVRANALPVRLAQDYK